MKSIPKKDLNNGKYEDFIENNEIYIWKRTIDGMEKIVKDPKTNVAVVFILVGGDLKEPKEFIIKREQITNAHLDKALEIMEQNEEYEYCTKIMLLKNDKRRTK